MNELYKELKKYGEVKTKAGLAKYTTIQIGGQAEFLVEVKKTALLSGLLTYLQAQNIDFIIMGGGSNLLFPTEEISKVVVKIATTGLEIKDNSVEAEAGVPLSLLVNIATKNNLSGLEWAAGIPGTVGGAVYGNAGSMGQSMADSIQKVFIWSGNEILELTKDECKFGYRDSIFKQNKDAVILKAVLALKPSDKQIISAGIAQNLINRKKFPALPSAGSFFKNIPLKNWPGNTKDLPEQFISRGTIPSGWLIENCGLKGFRVGDAGISLEHGNFLVNFGKATQEQVLQVVEEVQKKVYDKYGVGLEPEVQIVVP